jgi:hypothetical protein
MAFDPIAALREWKQKVAWLQERWRGTRREIEQLRKENDQWRRRQKQWGERERQLEQEREQQRQENEKLKRQMEEAQRASKRQAAPFSRGTRKQKPQTAGRKSGAAYGQRHSKAIPQKVDEVIAVPLPSSVSVEAPSKSSGSTRNSNRKSYAGRSGAASISPFAVVSGAINGCKGAIHGRPPMPWERRRCN